MVGKYFVLGLSVASASLLAGTAVGETLLGTYEFTDNSLAVTDADGGDGITFSDFNLNSYTAAQAFSDAGDLVADATLDYISLNGVESPDGSGAAFSGGLYLSFTITNNSGGTLNLLKLTGDFTKTNIYQWYYARVFTTNTPGSLFDDTISRFGPETAADGLFQDEVLLDGTSADAGANWINTPVIVADGASVTFYLPYIMGSSSTARYMAIDNIAIYANEVPEPGSLALLGLGGLCLIKRRRRGA